MDVHYVARNIYQYAFIKTLYREIGGQFLIHKPRAWMHLTKSFRGFDSKQPSRGMLGTQPKTKLMVRFIVRASSSVNADLFGLTQPGPAGYIAARAWSMSAISKGI